VPGRRGTGQTTCNREIALLSAVINRCRTWGLTTRTDNPCKGIRRFREQSRDRVLDFDEEVRLFKALPVALHPVTRMALETGCRLQSELLTLRWDAVDLDRQQVTIRGEYAKNGKSRVLPLGDAMTGTLRGLQATATSALVFPAPRGGSYLHHFSQHYFKAVRAAKLVGATVHCLRHSWASRLAESSGDLLLLKELGGWSSLSMVQR
jgi:integrase